MQPAGENKIPDDWWPSALIEFSTENPLSGEYVVIAELSAPWGPHTDKILYTGLVPPDSIDDFLRLSGDIGNEIITSGPWPSSVGGKFDYKPVFYMNGPEKMEPLVVSWESAGKTVLIPDQGFLMTYGLIPRVCENGEIMWDDPANRVFDVVKVEPPSEYFYDHVKPSRVLVRREYLQDYATVRNRAMIQTYYISNRTGQPDPVSMEIARRGNPTVKLSQRMLDISPDGLDKNKLFAQAWGFRHLVNPGEAPVSDDSDYGVLDWDGYGVVDGTDAVKSDYLPPASEYIFVQDAVLGEYEGWPGFAIDPEEGAVSYGGQWSIGRTHRIGRDLISVELKGLYEGNSPNTVKTWHKYCVKAPSIDELNVMRSEPNIAERAKAIIYAMVDLGEVLAAISSRATGSSLASKDLVKLDRAELEYHGWWKDMTIEPITRHAPMEMKEGEFLGRCVDLSKVVDEGLAQRILRQTLISLGIDEEDLEPLGRPKLLERLVQMAVMVQITGLDIFSQGKEIEERRKADPPPTPMGALFGLRDLRNSKSHRGRAAKQALKDMGICVQKMVPGWGEGLDRVYDLIAAALTDIRQILQVAVAE